MQRIWKLRFSTVVVAPALNFDAIAVAHIARSEKRPKDFALHAQDRSRSARRVHGFVLFSLSISATAIGLILLKLLS